MRIEQCLFGYEDGHRLLASSIELGDEAASLTKLSDLAPGTVFGSSKGYWTGFPLPGLKRYALLRTWPAPEMPRPGCVWTHALLLQPLVFEHAADLAVLRRLAKRPQSPGELSTYTSPLQVQLAFERPFPRDAPEFERGTLRLLLALYGRTQTAVLVEAPGVLDDPLFAVWSQQWPRLRRNFRFQTAASRERRSGSEARLDLVLTLEDENGAAADVPSSFPSWVRAAFRDISVGRRSELRDFLWLYGRDVRKQRGSFRPLSEIKLLHDNPGEGAGVELMRLLTESFPDADDAARLKQDVVDGVVVPQAQLDVLWFMLANHGVAAMPKPSEAGVERLSRLWPDRTAELLHLAERAADNDDPFSVAIFEAITSGVPLHEFWTLVAPFSRVRERMVRARPELMLAEQVLGLDNGSLAQLMATLPIDAAAANDIIPRLLGRDDARLAEATIDRFPEAAALKVMEAADVRAASLGRAWMRALVQRPVILLRRTVMGRVTRASLLYELADALGWLTEDVIRAGTEPWDEALVRASNDLPEDRADTMRAFMVALAISASDASALGVLERYFDAVHAQILKSRLHWRAREILSPVLPDIGWSRGWDLGLRLRLSIAQVYLDNRYDPKGYGRLARTPRTRKMLADAARSLPGGAELAQFADE